MCAQCIAFRCTLVCVCEDIEDTQLPLPSKNKLDVSRSRLLLLEYFSFFTLQEISLHTYCHLTTHAHRSYGIQWVAVVRCVVGIMVSWSSTARFFISFIAFNWMCFFRFALLFSFCFGRCHCYCGWMKANEMWKWNRLINKKNENCPHFPLQWNEFFVFFAFCDRCIIFVVHSLFQWNVKRANAFVVMHQHSTHNIFVNSSKCECVCGF